MGSPLSRERPTFSAVLGTTLNNRLPSTCHALPSPLLRNAPCNRSAMKFCPSKGPQLLWKLLVARIVDERTRSSCLDTNQPDKLEEFFSNGLCQLDLAPMLNPAADRVPSAPFFYSSFNASVEEFKGCDKQNTTRPFARVSAAWKHKRAFKRRTIFWFFTAQWNSRFHLSSSIYHGYTAAV